MDRELKTIKLSNGDEVKVLSYLTWGEKEKVTGSMIKGAKLGQGGFSGIEASAVMDGKYTLLELCVKEIKSGLEVKQFSKEWMDNLSVDDGDLLYEAIDSLTKKKV